MKRMIFLMSLILLLFGLFGCEPKGNEEEIWNKFNNALQLTSSLQYYSIETIEIINGETTNGKMIYTTDELNKSIAYKEEGNVKSWWYDGLIYTEENNKKIKKAIPINDFLKISSSEFVWTFEMVKDIKKIGDTITFSIDLSEFEFCKVVAKIGKVFLGQITVEVNMIVNNESVNKSLTYKYINPGKKPTVSLPENIDDYHY
ncbi:MAG: hypothetical protein ACOX56_04280 [Acholeplasmataceae bacterium]